MKRLNFTEEQYEAHQAKHGRGDRRIEVVAVEPVKASVIVRGDKMPNKTELRFEQDYLKTWKMTGIIERYAFESVTLKLAAGLRYTPDWRAVDPTSRIQFYEIKGGGPMKDDAVSKLKSAATMYPEYEFWLYRWIKGEWLLQRILPM